MDKLERASVVLPGLFATQLRAAEVYALFLELGSETENRLWQQMMFEELSHVDYLRPLFSTELPEDLLLTPVNYDRMDEVSDRVRLHGMNSFILRLEGALRLECAELIYGLEGSAAKRLSERGFVKEYPEGIAHHVDNLMNEARRYAASPNIRAQMGRLQELLDEVWPRE